MSEPAITALAVHISDGGNLPVSRIVIHATCPPNVPYPNASAPGTARGTAGYFLQTSSGGSAHYVEDVEGEEHCVPDDRIAWHAPPNQHSIGIEICGQDFYTRDQWLSPQVRPAVVRAAARAREVADRLGVPLVRLTVPDLRAGRGGICGHADVSDAFKQTDHSDPGPNFPWDHFMAEVLNAGRPSTPPEPITIRTGPSTGDTVTPHDVHVPTLDDQGNGWVDLPGVTGHSIVGIIANGQDPTTSGYHQPPTFERLDLAGTARITIHGGIPRGALDFTVWTAG